TAQSVRAVPNPNSAGGFRRQRNIGNQDARGASAAGVEYRMESAQRQHRRAGGVGQHGWLLDRLPANESRKVETKRSAYVDCRAISEQSRVPHAGRCRRAEISQRRISSRSRCSETSRKSREGMGLCSKIELMGPHAAQAEQPKLPIAGVKNLIAVG